MIMEPELESGGKNDDDELESNKSSSSIDVKVDIVTPLIEASSPSSF